MWIRERSRERSRSTRLLAGPLGANQPAPSSEVGWSVTWLYLSLSFSELFLHLAGRFLDASFDVFRRVPSCLASGCASLAFHFFGVALHFVFDATLVDVGHEVSPILCR